MCRVQRGARPQLLQDMIDLRKRLRGAPTGGTVSIVVTDIQGKRCLPFWLHDGQYEALISPLSPLLTCIFPPPHLFPYLCRIFW